MAFAFFPGLGMQEILLLGLCFMVVVVPIAVTLIVVNMNRKKRPDPQKMHEVDNRRSRDQRRIEELEKENRQLRERNAGESSEPSRGIEEL